MIIELLKVAQMPDGYAVRIDNKGVLHVRKISDLQQQNATIIDLDEVRNKRK
jgi:hypothetical protein